MTNVVSKSLSDTLNNRNNASARERFNNVNSPSMSGNSGFSGFGGRPDLDEDEGYDKKDEPRDRRGKFFFEPKTSIRFSFDMFNLVSEQKKCA